MRKLLFVVVRPCYLLLLALAFSGCDFDDSPNHNPPAGQGSIIVDNRTFSDINIFINGNNVGRVRAYDDKAIDLNPGVYRVVLDERNGDRTFRDDIDVIEGRLTILDVAIDPSNGRNFDVAVFFRSP